MNRLCFYAIVGLLVTIHVCEASAQEQKRKWYQGGTLHKAGALEWQVAKPENKLATCADFLSAMWEKGNLTAKVHSKLSTVDDLRPFAEELVKNLDAAMKKDPDPAKNKRLYSNQRVSEMATLTMILLKWLK